MRDKLIELLREVDGASGFRLLGYDDVRRIADYLIAHGVTFAPDNNVGGEIGLIKRVKYAGDIHTALLKLGWDIGTATAFLEGIPDAPHIERPKWIPVSERLPEEHDSMFIKLHGGDGWTTGMFRKISDEVLACVENEDGTKTVKQMHTTDGEWRLSSIRRAKVTHWMLLPEPPKVTKNTVHIPKPKRKKGKKKRRKR